MASLSWTDITSELTKDGIENIPVGQYLRFSKVDFKVMRKRNGKVWAKRVFLYKPDEVQIKDKNKIDKI